ncbi:hypothetical protein BDQ17DRAFT_1384248, partial [Cyathus striatus]
PVAGLLPIHPKHRPVTRLTVQPRCQTFLQEPAPPHLYRCLVLLIVYNKQQNHW